MKTTNQETQNNTSTNNSINSKEETMEKQKVAQSSVKPSESNSKTSKKEEALNSSVQQQEAFSAKSKTAKKPRKVAQSKMINLTSDYNSLLEKENGLREKINNLTAVLKAKQITISAKNKDEQDQIIKLNPAQLAAYRNELIGLKAELQAVKFKLINLSKRFSSASKTNAIATKAQITRNNVKVNRKNKAAKNFEALSSLSDLVADNLIGSSDPRMESLKTALNDHPQKINSLWHGILKQELAGKKISEENVVDLLSAAPAVRSKLSKRIAKRIS